MLRFRWHFRISILLIILLSFEPSDSRLQDHSHHAKPWLKARTEFIQTEASSTTNAVTTQANEDQSGFFAVIIQVFAAEMGDVNFYAALFLSFIYSPVFAIFAFLFACIISALLGAILVGNLLVKISVVAVSFATAALFLIFSCLTVYYIYTMKDEEIATENTVRKPTKREGFEGYINEEEDTLLSAQPEPQKNTSAIKKIFNFSSMKTRPFRFLFAFVMLFVAHLGDDALRKMVGFRDGNSFVKVFCGGLIAFLICAVLIGLIGFLIKEFLFRKFKISIQKTKIVKYAGCAVLTAMGVINAIIQVTSD